MTIKDWAVGIAAAIIGPYCTYYTVYEWHYLYYFIKGIVE